MVAKKSLSKNLSRRKLVGNEFVAAFMELHRGSDRVCAIMGGAMVDDALMKVIAAALPDPSDETALFHDQGAPFGTTKAKIVAGRAMGLFDDATAADLDLIRDIRNQFAHALLSFDFLNAHVEQACAKLSPYPRLNAPLSKRSISEPRERYESACWGISSLLMNKANQVLDDALERVAEARNGLLEHPKRSFFERSSNDIPDDVSSDKH